MSFVGFFIFSSVLSRVFQLDWFFVRVGLRRGNAILVRISYKLYCTCMLEVMLFNYLFVPGNILQQITSIHLGANKICKRVWTIKRYPSSKIELPMGYFEPDDSTRIFIFAVGF